MLVNVVLPYMVTQNDLAWIDLHLTSEVYYQNKLLQNPFTEIIPHMATIGEELKAARAELAAVRTSATKAVADSHDTARVVLDQINKVLQEASDLRAEVAELTNGAPAE